ncbi:MAG TPA: hypothetical protein VHV75_06635 [Solirubrobacteraceae bacterium]|nr:hypothetical protein [Solirubrobacteraceae bacterium]
MAPIGVALGAALPRRPTLQLWAADGEHPNALGSYLTACVLYAVITGQGPAASTFTAGLPPATAHWLALVAETVERSQRERN